MRILTAILVALAVLSTSVVSVRLHLTVARLRYRVAGLEDERLRTERDLRVAQAELDAAKAPRRLLERWAENHGGLAATAARAAPGGAPTPPSIQAPVPVPDAADPAPLIEEPEDAGDEGGGAR